MRIAPDPPDDRHRAARDQGDHPARWRGWAERQGIARGLLTVFIPHTSASLLIQENYSPEVRRDLDAFLRAAGAGGAGALPPQRRGAGRHAGASQERADPGAADDPGQRGRIQLGTWQGIFLLEHRAAPHRRDLILTLIGE